MTGYVTDSENEKHRHVGLDIMIEMLADKKRLHKSYSKRFQLAESRDEMYQRQIGPLLMKLCIETNFFIRLITSLNARLGIVELTALEQVSDTLKFLGLLLKAQTPSFVIVEKSRIVPILKILIT